VLALLDDGEVKVTLPDDSVLRLAVHRGFLTVDSDSVSILADSAELADDIDVARAEAALARARSDADDEHAAAALRRAEVRLEVASGR
jgi:F-type H+-transporting ATPase subunit epsilon